MLPRLPRGGERLDCAFVSDLKVECSLHCGEGAQPRISYCYLYQGEWRGDLACPPDYSPPVRPLDRLADCLHNRQTGCLLPPRLAHSGLQCRVGRGESWCRTTCRPHTLSTCLQDR